MYAYIFTYTYIYPNITYWVYITLLLCLLWVLINWHWKSAGVLFPEEGHLSLSQLYSVAWSFLCRAGISWALRDRVSHWTWSSPVWLNWWPTSSRDLILYPTPQEYTLTLPCLAFEGVKDLNSGFQACTTNKFYWLSHLLSLNIVVTASFTKKPTSLWLWLAYFLTGALSTFHILLATCLSSFEKCLVRLWLTLKLVTIIIELNCVSSLQIWILNPLSFYKFILPLRGWICTLLFPSDENMFHWM